jgi:hypothetical protein
MFRASKKASAKSSHWHICPYAVGLVTLSFYFFLFFRAQGDWMMVKMAIFPVGTGTRGDLPAKKR